MARDEIIQQAMLKLAEVRGLISLAWIGVASKELAAADKGCRVVDQALSAWLDPEHKNGTLDFAKAVEYTKDYGTVPSRRCVKE